MWIKNKILPFILISFNLSQVSIAKNVEADYLKQTIFTESGYSDWPTGLTPSYPGLLSPNQNQVYFHRWLGEKTSKISNILNQQEDIEQLDTTTVKKELRDQKAVFKISQYVNRKTSGLKTPEAKAFYFDYKNQNVGHLILQQSEIILEDSYYELLPSEGQKNTDLSIVKNLLGRIKSLPATQVLLPHSQETVTLYKTNRTGYTELYGLLEKEGHLYMLINGFLPASFADAYTTQAIFFIDDMISKGNWFSDAAHPGNTNRNENR